MSSPLVLKLFMSSFIPVFFLFFIYRLIWFCLHVANLAVVITILTYTWDQFVLQYFALNLHDPLYPIENMPFPGVSICSNNRISRQAAEKYAHEL